MVEVHHRHPVAAKVALRHGPRLLAVLEADHGVGHHHVVVLELTDRVGDVLGRFEVGVNPPLQVVDRFEVEGDRAEAHGAGLRVGGGIATRHPHRGVALAVGLREDVVRCWHRERLTMVLVVLLLPHARNLANDLVPHGLGLGEFGAVEGSDLMAAGAPTGAELKPALGKVIHHRCSFGDANRMVLTCRERGDRRADMDLFGASGDVPHHRIRRRHMAVFGESVVLAEPGVLPVVAITEHGVLGFAHEHQMLRIGIVCCRSRQVPVEEQSELHVAPSALCRRGRRYGGGSERAKTGVSVSQGPWPTSPAAGNCRQDCGRRRLRRCG